MGAEPLRISIFLFGRGYHQLGRRANQNHIYLSEGTTRLGSEPILIIVYLLAEGTTRSGAEPIQIVTSLFGRGYHPSGRRANLNHCIRLAEGTTRSGAEPIQISIYSFGRGYHPIWSRAMFPSSAFQPIISECLNFICSTLLAATQGGRALRAKELEPKWQWDA